MFVLNDDLSIYVTRGDIIFFSVTAKDENGDNHKFVAGDVVRIKVFGKKDAESVVLEKDFPVYADTEVVEIYLTKEDTKIGEVISKPKDYWYEVELNPLTNPQTIIGYDDDGAKVFKLFPEGDDITDYEPSPDDFKVMDDELDLTSTRPVENQAVARAVVRLDAGYASTNDNLNKLKKNTEAGISGANTAISVERARVDTLVSGAVPDDAELLDVRVGSDGVSYPNAGTAVREQANNLRREIQGNFADTPNLVNRNTFVKGYTNGETGEILHSSYGDDVFFDRFITSDFIPVISGETYSVYNSIPSAYSRIIFYNDKNTIHSRQETGEAVKEYTITIPDGVLFIRCSFDNLAPGNYEMYSAEKPAFNSIVKVGEDAHSPMRGTLDNELVNGSVKVNENGQMKPDAICGFKPLSNNMFNKYDVVDNKFLNNYLVWLDDETFSQYFTSGYIPVEPNGTYTLSPVWSVVYFTKQRVVTGYSENVSNTTITVTVPADCHYIRFRALMRNKDAVMVNSGDTLLPYEEYKATFEFIPEKSLERPKRFHTLREALCRWYTGEKFPVGFFGDSTTDGMGTTGGGGHETQDTNAGGWGYVDYINKAAYPYKLEQLLKDATNNANLRIYNIGYSGQRFKTIIPHYDNIFGKAYSDVKMVGIVFGINDRLTTNEKAYYNEFRENLVYTVEYLYSKGIQPFMVTTQATVEPYCPTTIDVKYYPMRDSESINTIANEIKREVADEYGLEVIDMNAYGEFMMNYSQIPMNELCTDNVHFKDKGHTLESEYLFSVLCGRCKFVKRGDVLTFASQKLVSKIPSDKVKNFNSIEDGFKAYAEYEMSVADDIVVQDFVVYVDEKSPVTLVACCVKPSAQYALVDGVKYVISSEKQDVCMLDVGVHRIKVMSGSTKSVNWIGFKIV